MTFIYRSNVNAS